MIILNTYVFHYKRPNDAKIYLKTVTADSIEEAYEVFEMRVKGKPEVIEVEEHRSENAQRMNGE